MRKNIHLKKALLTLNFLLATLISLHAARPTTHASGLNITDITCRSMQLNWTNGNGQARLIVCREGSATSWSPTDYAVYTPNSHFGKGTNYSSGNYVVYNSTGTNYVVIDSLKTGKTYYFTIFEHDNNGSNTLYYTTGAPSVHDSTYVLKVDFNVNTTDSCEGHNSFTFTNTSTSSIPGITYTYDFGDGKSSASDPVTHQYFNISGSISVTLNASPGLGCKNYRSKVVRVYPKKVAYIDFSTFQDTQCLQGNYFEIDPLAFVTPLPKSITYLWDFGDSITSTFKKMKHTYSSAGHYNVSVETSINVNLKPTGCKDTIWLELTVLPNPVSQASVADSAQCLQNNLFHFTDKDTGYAGYHWDFGDGSTSNKRVVQHSYTSVGIFNSTLTVNDFNGCSDQDNAMAVVVSSVSSTFIGLNSVYCASKDSIHLNPLYPWGTFSGYPTYNNILIPDQPGIYKLTYTTRLVNCSDSTSNNFSIYASPTPFLGKDTLIFSNQQLVLDAGNGVSYLWNTSETTRTLTIDGSTAPKGTTEHSIIVTNSSGCKGYDTIAVSVDYISGINILQNDLFKIYPNPATDHLQISNLDEHKFEWTLFNSTGKRIMSGNQEYQLLDLSGEVAGIYLMEIRTQNSSTRLKVLKL